MRYTITVLLLFAASYCWGQSLNLTDFNQRRLQQQKTAMPVLGAWGAANVGTGLALRGGASGDTRYLHDMNIGWGAINLGIAGLGYWASAKADPGSFDVAQTLNEQHKIQKILLFNSGLDVAYMLGGAYLIERSRRADENSERLRGFGRSVVLQGGFLLAFDLVVYYTHARHNPELHQWINGLTFTGDGVGMRIIF